MIGLGRVAVPAVTSTLFTSSIALTWIGSATSTATGTTFNFGNFSAGSDGLMIAICNATGCSGGLTDMSIGGSTATTHFNAPSGGHRHIIASRVVNSGANNVTMTAAATVTGTNGVTVGVWLLTGYTEVLPYHANWADTAATTFPIPWEKSVGGVGVFGVIGVIGAAAGVTYSSATERLDSKVTATYDHSFADFGTSKFTTANPSSDTETVSWGGASVTRTGIWGMWA